MKGHSRPSKSVSIIAALAAIGFAVIGVIKIIPDFGLFGWFWTVLAICIAGYHIFNLISENGIAEEVYSFEQSTNANSDSSISVEERLKKLDDLKDKRLISESEYQKQRISIIKSV